MPTCTAAPCGCLVAGPQDFLDPIDWATYESYLWANVARYFGRCAILFGALIQLQRAHPEAGAAKSGPSGGMQVGETEDGGPAQAP